MQASTHVFPFEFDQAARLILPILGIRPATARVVVDDDTLRVEFGPFHLETARDNIADATVTGPYAWVKAVGPHLSLADHGVTFGTNSRRGACIRFHRPVTALPGPHHPDATVTVADPAGLAAALHSRPR